jgi:hypothetical protein
MQAPRLKDNMCLPQTNFVMEKRIHFMNKNSNVQGYIGLQSGESNKPAILDFKYTRPPCWILNKFGDLGGKSKRKLLTRDNIRM